MRTYNKASGVWKEITTDANGYDDNIWVATLIQCLKLNLGEDPFFADIGIPLQETIATQVYPDFYIARIQSQFAQYFTSLSISRRKTTNQNPAYDVKIVTNKGAVITANTLV